MEITFENPRCWSWFPFSPFCVCALSMLRKFWPCPIRPAWCTYTTYHRIWSFRCRVFQRKEWGRVPELLPRNSSKQGSYPMCSLGWRVMSFHHWRFLISNLRIHTSKCNLGMPPTKPFKTMLLKGTEPSKVVGLEENSFHAPCSLWIAH